MLFLVWTIVGLGLALAWYCVVGPRDDEQAMRQLLLAVIGAMVGGLLFMLFGTTQWTSVNIYSLVVSICGALTFLAVYRSITQVY